MDISHIEQRYLLDHVALSPKLGNDSGTVSRVTVGGALNGGKPKTIMLLDAESLAKLLHVARESPTGCVAIPDVGVQIIEKADGGKRWTEFHLFGAAPYPHRFNV